MDISAMVDELINYYLIIAHKDISDSLKDKSEEEEESIAKRNISKLIFSIILHQSVYK